ncbi:MAG: hypothetical protein K2M12_03935 [Muribaculaceae bacterium]|nr:hypothetical protein [Muribaculaceae bacterium]
MKRIRLYSALATLVVCLLILSGLLLGHVQLHQSHEQWPPKHAGEISVEEYAEIIDLPMTPAPAADNPAPAPLPETQVNHAEPTPESGHDLVDRGEPAETPATVSSKHESPVKVAPKKPEKTGPTAEELKAQQEKKEQEEARRRATANTQNAFRNATGKNNTASDGRTDGNAGAPSDRASALNGRGTGYAGGGWQIPSYSKVPSTVTGSVKMMLKIDRSGHVTSVTFQGGDAPAATDPAVRRAVEAEVRARRFTRTDDNAPEVSTAYITYTFR